MDRISPSLIETLKSHGHMFAAGALAKQIGTERYYGCHYGMRSTKDRDMAEFFRGYDAAATPAMQIAMSHGINWNWFLVFSIVDGELVRHYEGRHHKGDDICAQYARASSYSEYRFTEKDVEFGEPRLITDCYVQGLGTFKVKDGPLPRFTNGYLPPLSELDLS